MPLWDSKSDRILLEQRTQSQCFRVISDIITKQTGIQRTEAACCRRFNILTEKKPRAKSNKEGLSFGVKLIKIMGKKTMTARQIAAAVRKPPETNNLLAYIHSVLSASEIKSGKRVFIRVKRGHYRVAKGLPKHPIIVMKTKGTGRPQKKLNTSDAALLREYMAGLSVRSLARKHNTGVAAIHARLQRAKGKPLRSKKPLEIVFKLQDGSVNITLEGPFASKKVATKFRKTLSEIVEQLYMD
jgi:hypothetical protein